MRAPESRQVVLSGGAIAVTALALFMLAALPPTASRRPAPSPLRQDDRAVALGTLLDTPEARASVDDGLRIAEALRRRYGIDTGNTAADRLAAARRAETEILEPLRVTPEQVADAARSLGYSLDPAQCSNYCDNVRRLALVTLRKRALKDFLAGS